MVANALGDAVLRATGRLVRMPPVPDLPAGRVLELPGRGSTYVTDTGGERRPTVFLLHALACTGLLTWYPSLDALRARYRLVVFDQRWHGQGIRSPRFSLDDCADDVVAVADALGVGRFVVAGFSMGSLVSQVTWHRHRDRVEGMVLAASATHFTDRPRRIRTLAVRPVAVPLDQALDDRWAWRQFRSTSAREISGAGAVLSRFDSRGWIGAVDVPAAVVVTSRDRVIPPARQRDLARRIPGATVYEADAGHASCVLGVERFRPALLAAAASVATRVTEGRSGPG